MKMNDATLKQVTAARPNYSTWLSANAGSGKTRVLTDRVARLLLEGVQPQHILCLTYTKAAASEMQNRLFKRLGEWAMLPDEKLRPALLELGIEGQVTDDALRNARTLFARAIEAPGGLKIQTIHSFCSSLLRRFPLEARVSPQFTEMEERAANLLQAEIVHDLAGGPDTPVIQRLASQFTGEDFTQLSSAVVQHRAALAQPLDLNGCRALFDLPENYDQSALLNEVFLGGEDEFLKQIIPILESGSATDAKAAAKLKLIPRLDQSALSILESVFLFGEKAASPFGAKIGKFPTKATQKTMGTLLHKLDDFMRRVEDSRARRVALQAAERTFCLHDFARVFLPVYEMRKQTRGWLDFDDLILRARDLLTDPAVAAWVLFRLDGGIDHILVDEAQDTSPVQWQVIELLAQEFTSGTGARPDAERTIFVVGDKKQSIYSFQGADPREFDRMRAEFAERLQATDKPLSQMELQFSFRSSHAILSLVDETFKGREASGFHAGSEHQAFKNKMPGRVDVWPVIEKSTESDEEAWDDPIDLLGSKHHTVVLAEQIAQEIRDMIDRKDCIAVEHGHSGTYQMRPVSEGDFLILVRRRSDLFAEIIRACKAQDLAIAGADRLKVGAELAVEDLAALLSFLATPEDSYALAVALKSPLFGWDEQKLYSLAQGRSEKYLWETLRAKSDQYPDVFSVLDDLRSQADFIRPYDLIERILTLHKGRKNLLARLGTEAEDGINAFLSQAMAYERNAVPSLIGFLQWLEADELEIKRQMDSASDQIRVMTVHGSKGLEAPIVIMPDTAKRQERLRDDLLVDDAGLMWRAPGGQMPPRMATARDAKLAAERAEQDRLLYVAMTRAERWLIVAGAGDVGQGEESWYAQIASGMERLGAADHDFVGGTGLRLSHENWDLPVIDRTAFAASASVQLPDWAKADVAAPKRAEKTLSPSNLGGAKALPSDQNWDEDLALQWGTWVHTLLEHLPEVDPSNWSDQAALILSQGHENPDKTQVEAVLSEAKRVLENQALQDIFAPETLAEVPVTATLENLGNKRLHGTIDRLIIGPDFAHAVDFKTNRVVPKSAAECPVGILRQMGAYASALKQVFPQKMIQTSILWTRDASLMELPEALTTQSLDAADVS